ncbi:MAG: glycosyltransferase family 4 protein [Acidobacteriota bacterium]
MPRHASEAVTSREPSDPRLISNSIMWQSERWNQAVTKIPASGGMFDSLLLAFRLLRRRRDFDVVLTVGFREAEIYGLVCSIFGSGKRPHVASEILLDEPRPGSMAWRMKRAIQRFGCRNIAAMIVFSSGERDLYCKELQLPKERIHFVPFHTNVLEPLMTERGGYGFSAGRSLRDYATFFAAAEKVDFPFVVVADRASVAHLRKPDNIELHCDVPRDRYLELLQGARFVVVPSKAGYRSIGQVVVLEAASFGKPVIASDVMGMRDYVRHGVDGLMVAPGNVDALAVAMQTLSTDNGMCERLSVAALERVQEKHTFAAFADHCLRIAAEACRRSA